MAKAATVRKAAIFASFIGSALFVYSHMLEEKEEKDQKQINPPKK